MDELRRFEGTMELPKPITPIPEEIAQRFVGGVLIDGAPIVHEGDKSKIFRLFEQEEAIPGITHGKLRVDARNWHTPDSDRHRDQIRFEYVDADRGDALVAEMHIHQVDEYAFELQHRYVQPEYREKKGIGTKLLQHTEDWLRQVAQARRHDVVIGLTAGQLDVFQWLRKQKYMIQRTQKPVLDEILAHPDRFIIEAAEDDSEVTRDLYVFPKGSSSRKLKDSIRLHFQKQIVSGRDSERANQMMAEFVPSWDTEVVEK